MPGPQEPAHHDVVSAHLHSSAGLIGSGVAAGQHLLDRRVENGDVAVNIHRLGPRFTLKSIQPALAIGIRFGERDVLPQRRPLGEEAARPRGEDARHGFQPFDRADLVTQTDVRPRRDAELELDDISEHAGGESREADAPHAGRLFEQPVVRGRVAPVARQMRREPRAAVVDTLVTRHAHEVSTRCSSRYGSAAATTAPQSGCGESAPHEKRSAPSILHAGSPMALKTWLQV